MLVWRNGFRSISERFVSSPANALFVAVNDFWAKSPLLSRLYRNPLYPSFISSCPNGLSGTMTGRPHFNPSTITRPKHSNPEHTKAASACMR